MAIWLILSRDRNREFKMEQNLREAPYNTLLESIKAVRVNQNGTIASGTWSAAAQRHFHTCLVTSVVELHEVRETILQKLLDDGFDEATARMFKENVCRAMLGRAALPPKSLNGLLGIR